MSLEKSTNTGSMGFTTLFWISVRKALVLSRLVTIGVIFGAAIFWTLVSSPWRLYTTA